MTKKLNAGGYGLFEGGGQQDPKTGKAEEFRELQDPRAAAEKQRAGGSVIQASLEADRGLARRPSEIRAGQTDKESPPRPPSALRFGGIHGLLRSSGGRGSPSRGSGAKEGSAEQEVLGRRRRRPPPVRPRSASLRTLSAHRPLPPKRKRRRNGSRRLRADAVSRAKNVCRGSTSVALDDRAHAGAALPARARKRAE